VAHRYPQLQPVGEFRDPVHGFIEPFSHEKEIIDTPEFQRLRRISQLGLTSYVYHGAEHSRFGHSIGVMHLAGEAAQRILQNSRAFICEQLGWSDEEFEEESRRVFVLARVAGLVHDLGHPPFSHAGQARFFPTRVKHEDYSQAVVLNTAVGDIIDTMLKEFGIGKEEVVEVLRKTHRIGFLGELIDSPWDVDKMDYLLRDSHYCGVGYGNYDLSRIVRSLALCSDEAGSMTLAIEEGGLHCLEGLVLARYFMFTQVYFHEVRRAYDLVLADLIGDLLEEQYGTNTYPDPADLQEYLRWDDVTVLSAAARKADGGTRNAAWMVLHRRHPKKVFSTLPHPDPIVAKRAFRSLFQDMKARFQGVRLWADRATDHPERYRSEDIDIPVRLEAGRSESFAGHAHALQGLKEIGQVRLYADVGDDSTLKDRIAQACREYMA
jgi:HD superfamily phosphohydrolase